MTSQQALTQYYLCRAESVHAAQNLAHSLSAEIQDRGRIQLCGEELRRANDAECAALSRLLLAIA